VLWPQTLAMLRAPRRRLWEGLRTKTQPEASLDVLNAANVCGRGISLLAVAALVRFDDLTPGRGSSFELIGPVGELSAATVDEVRPVVAAAEQAAADGAWVAGFVGYEAAPAFDPALTVRCTDSSPAGRTPLAWFGVFGGKRPLPPPEASGSHRLGRWEATVDSAAYRDAVGSIRDRIALGDTYQVNYSFRLRSKLEGEALSLYLDLAYAQRGAYSAYFDTGDIVVASASPELFFALDDGALTTRPMKGTAPRGRWVAEDLERAEALRRSEKERAENLMIVDLLRNDMGRVSQFGTVQTDSLFDTERYETVWQMTSTITSRTRPGTGILEVFEALFPCGSVTGAPKASTMAIIAGLETSPRGVYCGGVGIIAPGGRRARFSVGIRTLVVDRRSGDAEYGVGGGITWDSIPEGEHDEALLKAAVLSTRRPGFDLLETLCWDGVRYRELDRHLERMAGSAQYFRFGFDREMVTSALEAAGRKAGATPSRVRLTVTETGEPSVVVKSLSLSADVVRLAVDDDPVDSTDPMLFHKTDARDRYDSRRARHPGADDVVLVNERGEVTETSIANLVARIGGRWYTPPLESGLLPGVERDRLLAEGTIEERVLTPSDLREAAELAVINSVRSWRPARLLGEAEPTG